MTQDERAVPGGWDTPQEPAAPEGSSEPHLGRTWGPPPPPAGWDRTVAATRGPVGPPPPPPGPAAAPQARSGDPYPALTVLEPVAAPVPRGRRTMRRVAAGVALTLVLAGGAYTATALRSTTVTQTDAATSTDTSTSTDDGVTDGTTGTLPTRPDKGADGSLDDQGTLGTTTTSATAATTEQQVGMVTIDTVLGYQGGEAAGTGIILSADGLVLTNNHVIEGSTEITVTVESTGATYTAEVLGTDATADVALIRLTDASGLTPATMDDDGDPAVGDAVVAVGNANGTGDLSAAAGTVTALDQTITTQSSSGSSGETLNGLIEVAADVVSGDSGGAVIDSEGEVVGLTTAASSGSADITGYAIDIDTALAVVAQIEQGTDTDTITLGYPAFLGVELAITSTDPFGGSGSGFGRPGDSSSTDGSTLGGVTGALVGGVIDGTPAAGSGLVAGDTLTAVDGTAVTSGTELQAALAAHAPGDTVTLSWTSSDGSTHSAAVTLIAGPAD